MQEPPVQVTEWRDWAQLLLVWVGTGITMVYTAWRFITKPFRRKQSALAKRIRNIWTRTVRETRAIRTEVQNVMGSISNLEIEVNRVRESVSYVEENHLEEVRQLKVLIDSVRSEVTSVDKRLSRMEGEVHSVHELLKSMRDK